MQDGQVTKGMDDCRNGRTQQPGLLHIIYNSFFVCEMVEPWYVGVAFVADAHQPWHQPLHLQDHRIFVAWMCVFNIFRYIATNS